MWKGNLADIYKLGGNRGHKQEEEILAGRVAVRTKGENCSEGFLRTQTDRAGLPGRVRVHTRDLQQIFTEQLP